MTSQQSKFAATTSAANGRPRAGRAWTAWQLLRHFGPGWLAYRAQHAIARRTGWLARREAVRAWEDVPLSKLLADQVLADPQQLAAHLHARDTRFFFTAADLAEFQESLARVDRRQSEQKVDVVSDAARIAVGEFPLFRVQNKQLGIPPNWHCNALTGDVAPAEAHWSLVPDFDFGDIKAIWDLNRFGFAFDLVRAYTRTRNERFAEMFWTLVEDWRRHNPPNCGANWMCGQEASLRVFAWCFGLFAFCASPASTPERIAGLVQMIGFTGRRVLSNTRYAVSQQNNHGISEAAGLWTIGVLFPELRDAEMLREVGRRLLERLARELIYGDGSFAQHSWNYHRLMLHDYLWAMRLGELNGYPLSAGLRQRVARAGELLGQMVDETTGGVPCYGHDDGSLVLPLNNCSYFDYRPVVQATAAITSRTRRFASGPWDEDLLWLCGPSYQALPVERSDCGDAIAGDGGYVALRTDASSLFTRAAAFRHRPGQADMLHVDVWWRGRNIAIDPGTFSYNAPPPWNNPLATAHYHNTVTVDGRDQMTRISRFVWLPWLSARQRKLQYGGGKLLCYWQGENDGDARTADGAVHRRGVLRIGEEHWLVLDQLECSRPHKYRLHWLLADLPHRWDAARLCLTLSTPAGDYEVRLGKAATAMEVELVRADEHSPRGWRARG